MKKSNKLTFEISLYILIFLIGLALRLFQLGGNPLLESEAGWAFPAWQLSRGEAIPVGSGVAYLASSEVLFSLFGAGNFLARFWPALVGSALVWLPFFFKKDLNRIPALIIAGGIALDPTLVPASRFVDSPLPALVFLALAVGSFHARKLSWSFFFLGLGLLSGPDFWLGIALLVIVLLISNALDLFSFREYTAARLDVFPVKPQDWLTVLTPALLTFMILGSFFLRNFLGLTAWVGALPEFIQSWGDPVKLGSGKFLVFLVLKNPLILVFGLPGFFTAWRKNDRLGQILSIWFVVSTLGLLLYPGRQSLDLAWLTVPLWIAAGSEFTRLTRSVSGSWLTHSLAGLVVVLVSLNWLTFVGMIFQAGNPNALLLQLGLLLASLALIILSAVIVSSEWGWQTARTGLLNGAAAGLVLYLVASLVLDAYLVSHDPRSVFSDGTGVGQMELLNESIADVSITATGRPDSIRGALISDSQALRWATREFEGLDILVNPPAGIEYPLLITIGDPENSVIQDNYRGQDFVFSTHPAWGRVIPDDWISWIAFREGPLARDYLILWVRNDINSGY